MKNLIKFLALLLVIAVQGRAQNCSSNQTPKPSCPMQCCDECFPYYFCDPTGETLACSQHPGHDGHGTPATAYLLNCVNVSSMNSDYIWQPNGPPPQPANVVSESDPDEQTGANDQQSKDAGLFQSGQPPSKPSACDDPGDEPQESDYVTIENPDEHLEDYAVGDYVDDPTDNPDYISDSTTYAGEVGDFNSADGTWKGNEKTYLECEGAQAQYSADDLAWQNNVNSYTQVWFDGNGTNGSGTDGNNSLQDWYSSCSGGLQTHDGYCVQVVLESDENYWSPAGGTETPGLTNNYTHPYDPTSSFPTCSEKSCADANNRYIAINTTLDWMYQTDNISQQVPDPRYTLHPAVPNIWYTGNSPQSVESGFGNISFRQVVEHELGHWLGIHHPDEQLADGSQCANNATICGETDALMESPDLNPGETPCPLAPMDRCEFQKLYCDPCASSVKEDGESILTAPKIHPNPSTGAAELDYTVTGHSFVQVAIYNELGDLVRAVSSGYENDGQQSISLGTENLPSGNYVCRVRVGDQVDYINLEIRK